MKLSFNQQLLLFTIVILAGIGITGYAVYRSHQKLEESTGWVQHTQEVIYESGHVLSLVKDIQAAARGYAMTGDSDFLAPLFPAEEKVFWHLKRLRQLAGDNRVQLQQIDSLEWYTRKRLAFTYQTVQLRNEKGLQAVLDLTATRQGKYYTDQVRQITADLQLQENVLLKQRQRENERSVRVFNGIWLGMFVVLAVFTLLFFVTAGIYVSHRREAEERLRQSERKYDTLFNSIDEGFCIIEMIFDAHQKPVDYRFLVTNAAFKKQTGLDNAVGKRMREFAPEHEDYWFDMYGKIALTGESARFENRAEQLQRWYDVYAFRFGKPEQLQVAVLFNDITARKKAEEQLIAVNKELESFSYSVSHDLRAPLRAINGYARILSEDYAPTLDAEAARMLNIMMANAKKMSQLIDDLLNFSRLSRRELAKTNIDTCEMLSGICRELKEQYPDRNIEFKTNGLEPVRADAMIKQVWENLLSNAVKYTGGRERAVVEIKAEKKPREIVFSVRDNGAGFDMRYAGKLFGVFQRLHSEEEFEGTGVGLAIVQRVIAKHGGRVWAEGKVGEGAAFYFSLPKT